ncbi:MAG TPA: hypothetical protein VE262_01260 [Blastocatellia bacterium]|nr:hypothetical protein [Blastocatellia bacterium]
MFYPSRNTHAARGLLTLVMAAAAFVTFGCSTAPTGTNTNSNTNANLSVNANGNANANVAAAAGAPINVREPEQYSAVFTISGEGEANARQGNATTQVDFAKRGADRRMTFNAPPPIGQITYLERAGQKYLIIPARNQYVELRPEEMGVNLGSLMSPATMIEQLKARTQYENMGTETINGRTAVKYRFAGAKDTRTQAGTVQADSFVYVDEATGLPIRSQVNASTTSGATARVVTELRDLQLNPDPALFELPANMKKVTTEELKQQVQGFIALARTLSAMAGQGSQSAAPAATPAPAANANGNANRP